MAAGLPGVPVAVLAVAGHKLVLALIQRLPAVVCLVLVPLLKLAILPHVPPLVPGAPVLFLQRQLPPVPIAHYHPL